jgi:Methane oxygenase PmoA
MMSLDRDVDGSVTARYCNRELFRYVYQPGEPELESPRPFFHPVRTLGGDVVSLYRPHDHVWHKGIAWSLAEVGGMNFWGGPSYRRDQGYQQLDNNGRMRHDGFGDLDVSPGAVRINERLTWVTGQGADWIAEQRQITATVLTPAAGAWRLSFETEMQNISGRLIPLGSPTTQGRDNAGYGGLFWRGPRSFSGGAVLTGAGPGGEELMGARAPWLGYVGRHDGHGRFSTLIFADNPANFCFPCQWFVRTGMYACVCPAPFFSSEYPLPAGETLTLRFDVIVADGALERAACAGLAAGTEAQDGRR